MGTVDGLDETIAQLNNQLEDLGLEGFAVVEPLPDGATAVEVRERLVEALNQGRRRTRTYQFYQHDLVRMINDLGLGRIRLAAALDGFGKAFRDRGLRPPEGK